MLLLGFGLSVAAPDACLMRLASGGVCPSVPRGPGKDSRATIWRLAIKACISAVLGSFGEIERFVGTDGWLVLYALFFGVFALRRGGRFPGESFNFWDEACGLISASAIFHVFLAGSG